VESNLVDGCLYPDEIDEELLALAPEAAQTGEGAPIRVSISRYFATDACDPGWQPLMRDLPRIAYVVADGAIRRGRGKRGITSGSLDALLADLREDKSIRGVVLRIDSPGGDAVASDLLYRSVQILAKQKPVVVSMGDVAASGGYYIAAAGDAILAEVGTLTGSIGVFGGKLNFEGLYKKLGIAKDAVEHGAHAGLLSEAREFTPDERAALRQEMQSIYDVFVERVALGRAMSVDAVKGVAEGRIFSGQHARSVGLVDELGGPLESLSEVCKRAGLQAGDRFVVDMLPRRSRFSGIAELADSLLIVP
jgi:protease-4